MLKLSVPALGFHFKPAIAFDQLYRFAYLRWHGRSVPRPHLSDGAPNGPAVQRLRPARAEREAILNVRRDEVRCNRELAAFVQNSRVKHREWSSVFEPLNLIFIRRDPTDGLE